MTAAAPATYSFDNIHLLNRPVAPGEAGATFLTMLRLRDQKFQHLHRNYSIRVNVTPGLHMDVRAHSVTFNGSPVGAVEMFVQCTSHKLEALIKPVILSDLGYKFRRIPAEQQATLGLGDFIVLYRGGVTPATVIFMTDRPMQADWELYGSTIARAFAGLVNTFRRNDAYDLRVDYSMYVLYIQSCIDENFDLSEALQGVVSPLLVSPC